MNMLRADLAAFASLGLLLACTPESNEITFELQAHSFKNSEWSAPVNLGAPVNSAANEMNAAFSPDELSIYFVSTRAGGLGNGDIWVARRDCVDCPWGEPTLLGTNVNSPGIDGSPMISNDGHLLFFSSERAGGHGLNDVYVARRVDKSNDLGWGEAVNLGSDVNTPAFEAGGFYLQNAEDGSTNFYFVRGPNTVGLDIYSVAIDRNGNTLGPATFVAELSIPSPTVTDAHPSIRKDGREVFFYSNRPGGLGLNDLFRSVRRSVHEPWSEPEHLAAPLSSASNEIQPTLTYDGRTLIFASNRTGGLGGNDIWISTRTPNGN
jgi:hypothetical protein